MTKTTATCLLALALCGPTLAQAAYPDVWAYRYNYAYKDYEVPDGDINRVTLWGEFRAPRNASAEQKRQGCIAAIKKRADVLVSTPSACRRGPYVIKVWADGPVENFNWRGSNTWWCGASGVKGMAPFDRSCPR